jgi:hypothetical protein
MFIQFLNRLGDLLDEAKVSPHMAEEGSSIYSVVEEYARQNKLLLSNPAVLGGSAEPGPPYLLYGDNIARHAIKLADAIAKVNVYTCLYTTIKDLDLSIAVDGRPVVQLYGIRRDVRGAIVPVGGSGGLLLYPPEFELIDIYRKLYSPACAEQWPLLVEWEKSLSAMLRGRKEVLVGRRKTGGGVGLSRINEVILEWLKTQQYILVGMHACDIAAGRGGGPRRGKMQVVVETSIDQFATDFDNMIYQTMRLRTTRKTHPSLFQVEPRLEKTVISVSHGGRTHHLLDVFNNTHYELVPYVVMGGINVGDTPVLKMFLLIEMWFLRLLGALGYIDAKGLERGAESLLGAFGELADSRLDVEEPTWAGVYRDLVKYKKKIGLANGFPPSWPVEYHRKHGHWRSERGGATQSSSSSS